MRKFFNKVLMQIMFKTLPLIKYYPFKWLAPGINKSVNWYMQKRFPTPKAQPADPAQPAAQTPPPADQPKS
ncbi:MAG: hypothetical protein WC455_04625 [Dehalococcoidia bacterium]|jgi:hypothetical protein